MNGSLLIDTNIALYLLNGDKSISEILDNRNIYVSFITELELLGYPYIENEDISIIGEFLKNCIIVDLNQMIKKITISIKQQYKIKLPDAIIAATSYYLNIPLLSADKVFDKINELQYIKYEI